MHHPRLDAGYARAWRLAADGVVSKGRARSPAFLYGGRASEPLNLDAGCAGIVNNGGRLESGARRRGHEAAVENDPAGPLLETGRFRHRVGAVVRLAAVAGVRTAKRALALIDLSRHAGTRPGHIRNRQHPRPCHSLARPWRENRRPGHGRSPDHGPGARVGVDTFVDAAVQDPGHTALVVVAHNV